MISQTTDGALNGRVVDPEDMLAEQIRNLLRRHIHVLAFRHGDGDRLSVEIHSRRGRQQSYTRTSTNLALDIIEDVAGSGGFGIALHVGVPLVLVAKHEALAALKTTRPVVGGVQ